MRIAIVGSGVSGLGAAWLLSRSHDVTVFEKNAYFGGHANTVDVDEPTGPLAVDTGFIVYNTACYPNLIALFDQLEVPTATTEMSFAVSLDDGEFEYSGNGLAGLFGQRRNLVSPKHWRMSYDIIRFFKAASALDLATHDPDETLGSWLTANGYSQGFVERHILPMAAAIWSAPANQMLAFPAAAFARFFANHGLLQVANRPEWRTVRGGSREYVARIKQSCAAKFL
ncbi:MAG: FAD-dependent oxidoreductase, partial [Pseudomonadota bacterium]